MSTAVNEKQSSKREIYHRVSEGRLYHRCLNCWRSLALADGVAHDNGFFPVDRGQYPHASWCEHKGEF